MKEKDARVKFEQEQMVYVEREDGSYGAITTGSYVSKHYLDDYFDKRRDLEARLRSQLLAGEISPVAYHMERQGMTPADLADRTGLSTRAVKKHMRAEPFGKVKLSEALRYAEVFDIPLAHLFAVGADGDQEPTGPWEQSKNPFIIEVLQGKGA